MSRWRLLTAAGTAVGTTLIGLIGLVGTGANASKPVFVNWPSYLYSAAHTSDNRAATTITTANSTRLKRLWQFMPAQVAVPSLTGFYASPTVYNGVVYIGARNGYFYALNETTGKVIWKRFIGYIPQRTCGPEGFTSTATVSAGQVAGHRPAVYVYGATGYLYAMNTATGGDVWPPAKVAIPSSTVSDYYAWSSPLITAGNIYLGISSECDRPLVRAGLAEFSQVSGAYENTFWATAQGTVGGSIWSSAEFDGSSVYITTGNGGPGSAGFAVIKLSRSMSRQAIWTIPLAQRVNDSDFGGSPGVWQATVHGKRKEFIGACNKNGIFYAFETADISAGPVWTLQVGDPSTAGIGICTAAPLFDGSRLYLASNGTKIKGIRYNGSLREVDPATGAIIWQRGLSGAIIGTPGMDGGHVIAAASFGSTTNHNGLWLIDADTGRLLKTFGYTDSNTFGQPVFADRFLFVASTLTGLTAYGPR